MGHAQDRLTEQDQEVVGSPGSVICPGQAPIILSSGGHLMKVVSYVCTHVCMS